MFTGTLTSVATAPSGGGAATDVWTTNLRWTLIYRVQFTSFQLGRHTIVAVHPGGLCRYVNGPGSFVCTLALGSGLSGTSDGVQNPGGPSVPDGCLHMDLSLRQGPATWGLRPLAASLTAPLIMLGAPTVAGYNVLTAPASCAVPISGAAACSPAYERHSPTAPTLTQYDGPTIRISRPRQTWSVSGTCVGDGGFNSPVDANFAQNAHWKGALTATRISHVKGR